MTDTADISQGMFSRSTGLPPALGTADSEIKARVPYSVKSDFDKLAHSLGLGASELLRSVILVRLYGVDAVSRMYSDQALMVAGIVPRSSHEAAEVSK